VREPLALAGRKRDVGVQVDSLEMRVPRATRPSTEAP
jgi:hypothetical protein